MGVASTIGYGGINTNDMGIIGNTGFMGGQAGSSPVPSYVTKPASIVQIDLKVPTSDTIRTLVKVDPNRPIVGAVTSNPDVKKTSFSWWWLIVLLVLFNLK